MLQLFYVIKFSDYFVARAYIVHAHTKRTCINAYLTVTRPKGSCNVLSIYKHGPYARGPPGNCPACPCVKTALYTHLSYISPILMLKIYRPRWAQCDDNTLHDPLGQVIYMFNCIYIYSSIPMSGCVGMGPSALLFPGARDAVKTIVLL
jgi:hypothetical protein